MNWTIRIPFSSRSDALVDVAEATRELPTDDARITRQIVLGEILDGTVASAGELIDKLDGLDPHERRQLLDAARERCGLPTTVELEDQRRFEAANASARLQGAKVSEWQICPAEGCGAIPVNQLGAPIPTTARRWWCEAHRDQAAPGDLESRPSPLRISESGAIVETHDDGEHAREAAAAESRRSQLEAQAGDRQAEADAIRQHREAADADMDRLLPPGVRP